MVRMNEPRIWKWMVPALLSPCPLILQLWLNQAGIPELLLCSFATLPAVMILAIQAAAGFGAYYREIEVRQLVEKRNALATTPETRLLELGHLMHPETVRLLLANRQVAWMIPETPQDELVDFRLEADPRVRWTFVEYMLRNSNDYSLMPKNRLGDKSYVFDKRKLVTDYQQYDAFFRILLNRGIVTEAHGNQPGLFIEPWNPARVARQFGISLEDEIMEEKGEQHA
jgi:hypothetical protein